MKRIGLIGRGLAHSVSAAMQQAALDEAGLDIRYEPWDTEPEGLEARQRTISAAVSSFGRAV